jgi:signal transduction histidine kinase/CheY-like chemotaxis protein/HPt (histidine-containing phosphotransfer) domain-containing protein
MHLLSLRVRVAVLVLVGVLPLLCFNLGNIYFNYRADRAQAEHNTLDVARRIALAIEGELRLRVAILEVLALSDALAKGDLDAFRVQADAVRAHRRPGTHILLVREDGQQLMNTALPPGAPLPMRLDLENQRRVFASKLPSVSNVYIGRVLQRPIVAIDVPVRETDGSVHMVLSLTPMLDAFRIIIARERPGENWLVDMIDRSGRRIASLAPDEREAGQPEEPVFLQAWTAAPEGTVQVVRPDGKAAVWGFTRVPEFGWAIAVGVTRAELIGPALRSTFITCGVGLALLAMGLALAHWVSHSVVGPISALTRFAASPDGEPMPIATRLRETDKVAAILMTEARQRHEITVELIRRTVALKQSNEELEKEVSIRKIAEVDLHAAMKASEQASEAKSRFLAAITHELRTPLHGILGYAELLSLEGGVNSVQSQRLNAMMAAGQYLLSTINAVLDVSQIEADQMELRPADFEMRDLLCGCLDVVRPAAETKGLALVFAPTAPLRVFADPTRLQQVLVNLLGNAVKFTATGSVEVRLQSIECGTWVCIEVADAGPGIWASHRSKLFQIFERLNAEAVSGIEGSGLGLALSAKLMELMGGRIGYSDNPGGGSIFRVELPCGAPASVSVEAAAPTSLADRAHLRVLVVDDEAMNRNIASGFLSMAGHDVVCVDNGAAAVEAAAGGDFDVILMDVRMPGVNGLQATRRIRALPAPRGAVRIIAVTAQAFAQQIETCREAGMDGHVSKPFRRAVLLATIEKIATSPRNIEPAIASLAAAPGDIGLPIFDRAAFEDIINTMAAADVAENLRTMIARCETLLGGLQSPDMLTRAGELAEAAHKLAGGAGTFGFLHVAAAARRFEVAADAGAPETVALGDHLAAAINASVALARQEIAAMVATTERELAAD